LTGLPLQVLFLLYHYFNAREIYNAIRVFIAGYVWLTGYGNFLYYYHYKDFSLGRCVPSSKTPVEHMSESASVSVIGRSTRKAGRQDVLASVHLSLLALHSAAADPWPDGDHASMP